MKGIVLAGGAGSRLDPMTRVASKQLQPVYDKPMVYYPIATLLSAGIRDIIIISTPDHRQGFERLLGDGSQFGIKFAYRTQPRPAGIAQALVIAEEDIRGDAVALILGDNIFYGDIGLREAVAGFSSGATVFAYPVTDPHRYGVIELDADGAVRSIEEKPENPKSHYAIPGLYLYDQHAAEYARGLEPSARGELEITDLNNRYLERGELCAVRLGRGVAWLDSGTPESLLDAANFVATIERRQGVKIACIEEIAFRQGWITRQDLVALVETMPDSSYRTYVETVAGEGDEPAPS